MGKITKWKVIWAGMTLIWVFHFLLILNTSIILTKIWFWNLSAYFTPVFLIFEIFVLLLLLIFRRYRLSLIPVFLLVISFSIIKDTLQFHDPLESNNPANSLKVLTYNVALIPYDEINVDSASIDTNASNEFYQLLLREKPDVLCLQEFHHVDSEHMDVLYTLIDQYGYQYYVMTPVFLKHYKGYSGPIILSKYPIIHDYNHKFEKGDNDLNHLLAVDIVQGIDTVRVINVHLKSMSIRPSKDDNYQRLRNGFYIQNTQIEEAYEYVKNSPFKVVFCGDFNSLPYSYTYQFLKKHLKNTFDRRGNGFGYTLNRFPYFVRIDNVFTSPEITVKSHKVLREYKQSDHFPLLVELGLNK